MHRVLGYILSASATPQPIDGVEVWWQRHRDATADYQSPIERAIAGGFAADRPAYAFASGYQEALRQLLPDETGRRLALCATEVGGNSPKHISTTLDADGDGFRLTGSKAYVTLGTYAEQLLVFAVVGVDAAGRNRLAMVRVPADRAGVAVEALGPTPFVPEIPHARLRLDGVRVEATERFDGDGYTRYLKPFRTVEDVHVYAAVLAWLVQVGRRNSWPQTVLAELCALLAACATVARSDETSGAVHVALGGLILAAKRLLAESAALWESVDDPTRAMWRRDGVLLDVATKARERRFEVAWQRLRTR